MSLDENQENAQDDFYTFLGISKDATETEITNAYRRLSRMYHPDKHKDDQKEAANILFNRTKKAYEVLKDPHKRAIYDTIGIKAINDSELYELVKYSKTADEIRSNYERIMKDKEEEQLRGLLHPRSSVTLGFNATNLFKRTVRRRRRRDEAKIKFVSMDVSAAIDVPINKKDKLSLTGLVSSQDKTGHHAFTCSLAHPFSEDLQTELHITAAERFALKGKVLKCLTKQDIVSTSLIFSPELFKFYSKEVSYIRILNKYLSFNMTLKSDLTNESTLTSILSYNKDKNKIDFEFMIGIKSSHLSLAYMRSFDLNDTKLKTKIKYDLNGASLEYGCETRLTKNSIVGGTLAIGDNVKVKLTAIISNQAYAIDILLSDDLVLGPIVYGSICPMITYLCVKKYLIEPYQKSLKEQKEQDSNRTNMRRMNEKRKEAELSISLMQETYLRSVQTEEAKDHGFIIDVAIYGNADNLIEFVNRSVKNVQTNEFSDEDLVSKQLILVTIPLQCLVRDSILSLPEGPKSNLPGFFDPSPNHDKKLYIRYKFRQSFKDLFCLDNSKLKLPMFS